jgi:hypothetical protein
MRAMNATAAMPNASDLPFTFYCNAEVSTILAPEQVARRQALMPMTRGILFAALWTLSVVLAKRHGLRGR